MTSEQRAHLARQLEMAPIVGLWGTFAAAGASILNQKLATGFSLCLKDEPGATEFVYMVRNDQAGMTFSNWVRRD